VLEEIAGLDLSVFETQNNFIYKFLITSKRTMPSFIHSVKTNQESIFRTYTQVKTQSFVISGERREIGNN
jgi:hypothetical protein